MTKITHEELIAAGYRWFPNESMGKDFVGYSLFKMADKSWSYISNRRIYHAGFCADTIQEAEALAHLLHAASQGLPRVREALEHMEQSCCDSFNGEDRWQSDELGDLIAAAKAELGGAGNSSVDASDLLLDALIAYRSAQRRMRDRWSEGDDNVKQQLWRELHNCEATADHAIELAKKGCAGERR